VVTGTKVLICISGKMLCTRTTINYIQEEVCRSGEARTPWSFSFEDPAVNPFIPSSPARSFLPDSQPYQAASMFIPCLYQTVIDDDPEL
jgi:hypothetical protein